MKKLLIKLLARIVVYCLAISCKLGYPINITTENEQVHLCCVYCGREESRADKDGWYFLKHPSGADMGITCSTACGLMLLKNKQNDPRFNSVDIVAFAG